MQPEGFRAWLKRYAESIGEATYLKRWEQFKIVSPGILLIDLEKGRDLVAALREWQEADE